MTEALMFKTQTELQLEALLLADSISDALDKENCKKLARLIEILMELTKREGA